MGNKEYGFTNREQEQVTHPGVDAEQQHENEETEALHSLQEAIGGQLTDLQREITNQQTNQQTEQQKQQKHQEYIGDVEHEKQIHDPDGKYSMQFLNLPSRSIG